MLSYLLMLKLDSKERASDVAVLLEANETDVVLGLEDGLKEYQTYVYSVTAINIIGNTTTSLRPKFRKMILNSFYFRLFINFVLYAGVSDLQDVTLMVVGESTVDIQCLFISGSESDAVGCKLVFVSDHQSINNETVNLTRNNKSAYGQINLTHKASCYHSVVAYTITTDHQIVSISSLEKTINVEKNIVCSGKISLRHLVLQ